MARLLSRRLALFATVGGIVLAVASLCMSLRPGSAINEQAFARIENGMTLREVEDILGGPARDESNTELSAYLPDYDDKAEGFTRAVVEGLMLRHFESPMFGTYT